MEIRSLVVSVSLLASGLIAQDPESDDVEKAFVSLREWRLEDDVGFLNHRSGLPDGSWGFDAGGPKDWSFREPDAGEKPLPPPGELERWIQRRLYFLEVGEPSFDDFEVFGGWEVEGTAAQVEEVRRSLAGLHAAFTRSIRYRLTLVEGDALVVPSDTSVLSDEDRRAVLASGRVVFDRQIQRRHGAAAYVGSVRTRSFVRDYETEIAQGIAISDPRVDLVCEGPRLCVLGHRTAEEDLLLVDLDLVHGKTDPKIERRDLGAPVLGKLDVPTLRETRVQTSFAIRRGQTIALSVLGEREHGPSFVLLVSAELAPAEPTRSLADIDVRSGRVFARPLRLPRWASLKTDWKEPESEMLWTDPTSELAAQFDLVSHNDFFVALDVEDLQRLDALYRSLAFRDGESLAVEVRDGVAMTRLRIPVRAGGRVVLKRSWGTYEVGDYEVEIAQAVAIANPSTWPVYDGVLLSAILGTGGDRAPIELQGRVRALGDVVETQLEGTRLGKLFRHEAAELPFSVARDLAWGEDLRVPLERDRAGRLTREVLVTMQRGRR